MIKIFRKLKGLAFKVALASLIPLILQSFNPHDSTAEKPQGPLSLAFNTDFSTAIDAVTDVSFTVTSRVDTPELVIGLELPEGLPHLSGELDWTGAVSKNQPVILLIGVGPLLEGQSYEVIGRATVRLPNGSTWTQAASIILEPKKQEKSLPHLRKRRQGEIIREIPAE